MWILITALGLSLTHNHYVQYLIATTILFLPTYIVFQMPSQMSTMHISLKHSERDLLYLLYSWSPAQNTQYQTHWYPQSLPLLSDPWLLCYDPSLGKPLILLQKLMKSPGVVRIVKIFLALKTTKYVMSCSRLQSSISSKRVSESC